MNYLLAASRRVIRFAEFFSAGCLLIACVINFANIVGRYFFHAPIIWAQEIMQFLMIAGVFFGAPIVTLRRAHIRMDMLVTMFPPRISKYADILSQVALFIVCCVFIWLSVPVILEFINFGQLTEAAAIPVAIPQSALPIGMLLIAVAALVAIFPDKDDHRGDAA